MRLAKTGYYGGNPEKILRAPVDVVVDMIKYESFEQEYKDRLMKEERNRNENS